MGVNKELRDKVKVQLFFIDDDESSWDEQTINAYYNKQILPGLNFLEQQASRYGVSLDFTTEKYATVLQDEYVLKYNGKIDNNADRDATGYDVMDKIASILGYSNAKELHTSLANNHPYGEVIMMPVVNKEGISFASMQASGSPGGKANAEYCIIFTDYPNKNFGVDDNTHMAASVAHEMLHIFGAEDLYLDEYKETARQLCPKDIMLLDYLNIEKMQVNKYTAYSIGWSDKSPY